MKWLMLVLMVIVLARSDNAMDCEKCARECPGIFQDSFCNRCQHYCSDRRGLRRRCIENWHFTGCKKKDH